MKRGKVVKRELARVEVKHLNQEYETTIEVGDVVFAAPWNRQYYAEYHVVVDITPNHKVMSGAYRSGYGFRDAGIVLVPAYHCVRFAAADMELHTQKHIAEYLMFRHELTPAQEWLQGKVAELEKQRVELMKQSEKVHGFQGQIKVLGVENRDKLVVAE